MPDFSDLIALVRGPVPDKPLPAVWNYAPCHFGALGGMPDYHRFYFDADYKLRVHQRFQALIPRALLLPGYYPDFGVVTEASAFGGEILWYPGLAPHIYPSMQKLADVDQLRVPKAGVSGLMPMLLTQIGLFNRHLESQGLPPNRYIHTMGPAEVCALVLGHTQFFMGFYDDPGRLKTLLEIVTELIIDWLHLQNKAVGGALVLCVADHMCSQISPRHLEEWVFPFEEAVFKEFPEPVKIYHNEGAHTPGHIELMIRSGAEIWHFGSDVHDIADLYELVGDGIVLFGGLNPHGNMLHGTPEDVREETRSVKKAARGRRLLLSTGTGTTPEVGLANQQAMVEETLA